MEEQSLEGLSRRERRRLLREEEKSQRDKFSFFAKFKKIGIWILVVGVLGLIGFWLYSQVAKPLPGQAVADQGREHISDGSSFEYNSNPPTSGSHYEEWTRAGVYDKPVSDGHLVHSLEHGYIILSYNCVKKISNFKIPALPAGRQISNIYAHEEDLTDDKDSTPSGELIGDEWKSDECRDLVNKLTSLFEKKGKKKLIVIPRPTLDTRIALTAWTRIDKFDDFDEKRIINFINAFRDHGPEKTME